MQHVVYQTKNNLGEASITRIDNGRWNLEISVKNRFYQLYGFDKLAEAYRLYKRMVEYNLGTKVVD